MLARIFAIRVETLYQANITGGCGPGLYCPSGNVTRGQMRSSSRGRSGST